MTRATVIKLVLAIAVVYVIQDGIHFNDESQQVVITEFGDPVGQPVTAPGLFFDLPLVQTENYFSKQALEYESTPTQVPTRDKRYISVAAFALWRINDPLKFFRRVQNEAGAQARLDEIVAGEVRNAVARDDLIELVRTTTRSSAQVAAATEEEALILTNLEKGRHASRPKFLRARANDPPISALKSSTFGSNTSATSRMCRRRCLRE
jgi:membrane protease subunit HflC